MAELLELVGLGERAKHRPHELSGGEQQRVPIARALANRPRLLLADEPTGQLDSETGQRIMLLIRTVVRAEGVTAIVATHDPVMLEVADRVIELRDRPTAVATGTSAAELSRFIRCGGDRRRRLDVVATGLLQAEEPLIAGIGIGTSRGIRRRPDRRSCNEGDRAP